MSRTVCVVLVHLDLDAFFASVEMRLWPAAANRPVVVAWDSPRGVVAAASYPARARGVRSAMPLHSARAAVPDLLVLPPRFAAYREVSEGVFALIASFLPDIDQVGLDEGYAAWSGPADGLVDLIEQLRGEVRTRFGVPISVGAGISRVAAKLASRAAKPDGVLLLSGEESLELLRSVSVSQITGVGPRTSELLQSLGVETLADLDHVDAALLRSRLGAATFEFLLRARDGRDREVRTRGLPQLSVSRTFPEDLLPSELEGPFESMLLDVLQRLRGSGLAALGVSVQFVTESGQVSRQSRLTAPTGDPAVLAAEFRSLWGRCRPDRPVRLLGLGFTALTAAEQLTLPGVLEVPDLLLPDPVPPSLFERSHYGSEVRHPVLGGGVLRSLTVPPGFPPFRHSAGLLATVEFDRLRVVEFDRLSGT